MTPSPMLSFHLLQTGTVGISGSTGAVLRRSLEGLRNLNNRLLADVRLSAGLYSKVRVNLRQFIEEEATAGSLDANARGLRFTVETVLSNLAVEADRMLLGSAVANLLQNAFKFTRPSGHVVLRVRAVAERILIEIQDECGGLPPGVASIDFSPFKPRGKNPSGLGLGLSIARRGVEASGGRLLVRDLPDVGCVFTIDLPAAPPIPRPVSIVA